MLLNYHIGRLVLSSLCVGDLVRQAEAVQVTSSWSFILQMSYLSTRVTFLSLWLRKHKHIP